jgi:hypothetical protein
MIWPPPQLLFFWDLLKNQQKSRSHFGKVWEWGKTWNIVKLTIEVLTKKSIIKEWENGIKTSNFKIFFIYTLYLLDYLCYKQKLSVKENFIGHWFYSRDKQIFVFDVKILKLWLKCVEISNDIVHKWRKFWNSKP